MKPVVLAAHGEGNGRAEFWPSVGGNGAHSTEERVHFHELKIVEVGYRARLYAFGATDWHFRGNPANGGCYRRHHDALQPAGDSAPSKYHDWPDLFAGQVCPPNLTVSECGNRRHGLTLTVSRVGAAAALPA